MKPRSRRILSATAVLGWSAVLLYFYGSGRVNQYLAADFRPFALAGGLGLAVLGLFNLLTAGQEVGCGHDHEGGDEDAHDHEHGDMNPWLAFALMSVPVALSVAWTKDHYSPAALAHKGLYDAPAQMNTPFLNPAVAALKMEDLEQSHRKTAEGHMQFNLMELVYSAGDREVQGLLDGLKVETEGRWMDEKIRNPHGTRKRLYRLFLTCCAADGRAVPIVLEFGKPPPEFPENGWVKVSGTMRFPLEEGVMQPLLVVEQALAVEPPAEENLVRPQ